ncbi:tRNA (adenosine(37)-N6)-threonylcarbamoyltransferase complex ATPase subunit type 1 TsaE [soil metagenome]
MAATIHSASAAETQALGERLGALLEPGDVVLLHGDLGAGKTTVAQGILRGLQVTSPGQSPTFTLVSEHQGKLASGIPVSVRHLDLYRLSGPQELDSFGYADLLHASHGITIVEWPERAGDFLPGTFVLIELNFGDDDKRVIGFSAVPSGDRFADLA